MQRAGKVTPWGHRVLIAACVVALVAGLWPAFTAAAAAGTLDQIKAAGRVRLGYRPDARPFSYRDESGTAAGYSVAVCQQVINTIAHELALPTLTFDWVPVTVEDRFAAVQQGKIDLLCTPDAESLASRKDVSFSIPIFPGGLGAMVRADAPLMLQQILNGKPATQQPVWRASAGQLLQTQTFTVVAGTPAADWVAAKLKEFQLTAEVAPVSSYDAGVQALLDRKANVFFADRSILLDAAARNQQSIKLVVLERRFTDTPLALALPRGDEDFRLAVDRALSRLYSSEKIKPIYTKYFGEPDASVLTFLRWNTLPE
jgi:ABC-type amino acid transport substrate-binding protein